MQDAVLAMKDGSCETSGVIRFRFPNAAIMTTLAYGVQMRAHKHTFVMATLAILISELSAFASWTIIDYQILLHLIDVR